MAVRPGAEPLTHDGDDVGLLLCHGFTGNPSSLRPWAEALVAAGHTVRLPRLPGHGTTWQEMNRTTWQDWYGEVDAAFTELRGKVRVLIVGGLSMGGALALRLAEQHAGQGGVDGIVLVNPAVGFKPRRGGAAMENPQLRAVPFIRWVMPSTVAVGGDIKKPGVVEDAYERVPTHALHSFLKFIRLVEADLPTVHQPLLVFHSPEDHVVPAASSELILRSVSSKDVTETLLTDSYHVATLDNDAPMIFSDSLAFAKRISDTAGGSR